MRRENDEDKKRVSSEEENDEDKKRVRRRMMRIRKE